MTIINPLPYTIANGDPVDATPVQANLNQIVSNVNANAAAVAGNASQEFLVATTTNPAGAVPLAQAQSQFAGINGSSSQAFNVASGTSGTLAIPLSQIQAQFAALNGSSSQAFSVAPATSLVNSTQLAQTLGGGAAQYTDQTANRAIGVVYTNNTSRPLVVSIDAVIQSGVNTVLTDSATAIIYGGASNSGGNSMPFAFSAIVPPGATYVYNNSTGSINAWYEY